MLVTQWRDHDNRETRDIDFLGFGSDDPGEVKTVFAEIMAIEVLDGLVFDTVMLSASPIREDMEYGGIRLRTAAYLERTRIPVVLDIGFGDALANASQSIEYPSLLDMERPHIRSYPPASVIAEKFQAVVALGLANGRMKDFYDLWAVPKTVEINAGDLDAAIAATFEELHLFRKSARRDCRMSWLWTRSRRSAGASISAHWSCPRSISWKCSTIFGECSDQAASGCWPGSDISTCENLFVQFREAPISAR